MRDSKFYTLLAAGAPRGANVSTNTSPIKFKTDAAHGMVTGDTCQIFGHTTNISANGIWTVTLVDADEVYLDGSVGVGVGANSGILVTPAPKVLDVQDFKTIVVTTRTDGGGDYAGIYKFVGSISEDMPNFGGTISTSNIWEYLDFVDIQSNTSIDGDTGVTVAGADDTRMFEVNVNGLKWFTVIHTDGSAGEITMEARLFAD